MSGFLSQLFGGKSKKKQWKIEEHAEAILHGVIERAQLELSFETTIKNEKDKIFLGVDFFGVDEELMTEKEAVLWDDFQLFLTRSLQHNLSDFSLDITCDSNNFREKANKWLLELADKLTAIA